MQEETSEAPSVEEQLRNLATEHFGWAPHDLHDQEETPFDISRPNIHNNKREFQLERDTVKGVVEGTAAICNLFIKTPENDSAEETEMIERLRRDIDIRGFKQRQKQIANSAQSLALQNVRDSGFFLTSLYVLFDMRAIYSQRLSELEDQEDQFWKVSNRPPNYYARTIALRFAQFYARQTGTKPTYGTSRDGPHPSTDFARLLERVFTILDIKAAIRKPAEYAISKITDEDLGTESLDLSKFLLHDGLALALELQGKGDQER